MVVGARHVTRRSRGAKCLLALAMAVFLILPPRQANAEAATILIAIAIALDILGQVIALGDSGADPRYAMLRQNHRMLKIMHERLGGVEKALKVTLRKLDDLPDQVKKKIDTAFVNERVVNVRSAMRLLLGDIEAYRKKQLKSRLDHKIDTTPISDLQLRLHDFQLLVENLLQTHDDLVVFDIIAARYVEHAILATQPNYETDWNVRKKGYINRLLDVFSNKYRRTSLPWKYSVIRNTATAKLSYWKQDVDRAIKEPYVGTLRQHTNCESSISYRLTEVAKSVHDDMNDLDVLGMDRLKFVQALDTVRSFYEYAMFVIQYELGALDRYPPPLKYPKLTISRDYESDFLNLRRKINDVVNNVPPREYRFVKPPNQICM